MQDPRKKLLALVLLSVLVAAIILPVTIGFVSARGDGGQKGSHSGSGGGDDDEDDKEVEDEDRGQKSDFALFTTQDTGPSADNFVTCNATREAHLHLTATNFDSDENKINIVFADGDSVLIRVLAGQSFSLTQVIGTHRGVDDVIKIDPLDQDGDVNPMVGWVSIHRVEGGAKVSCTVTTFNPIP